MRAERLFVDTRHWCNVWLKTVPREIDIRIHKNSFNPFNLWLIYYLKKLNEQ